MHIHKVRQIVNNLNQELSDDLNRRLDQGKTIFEVTTEDPFLAGQCYAMSQLTLRLLAAELDEEYERELRRAKR
jgi:hypothetical protein